MTDEFVEAFKRARDVECKEEIFYKQSLIVQYMQFKEVDSRPGSPKMMWMYWKQLHPFWNLWYKFDFGSKRLFRLTLVIC